MRFGEICCAHYDRLSPLFHDTTARPTSLAEYAGRLTFPFFYLFTPLALPQNNFLSPLPLPTLWWNWLGTYGTRALSDFIENRKI